MSPAEVIEAVFPSTQLDAVPTWYRCMGSVLETRCFHEQPVREVAS